MSTKNYYITHIVKDSLPRQGFKKLFFYTGTAESIQEGKYYWGRGNNRLDKSILDKLIKEGKALELHEEIALVTQKGLWIDPKGCVYMADIKDPMKELDNNLLKPIVVLKEEYIKTLFTEATKDIQFKKPQRKYDIIDA